MIISKTPLRMSFVGGGSDLPSYYQRFGGAVVSTTIDQYVYITVNKKFDDNIRLSYSITEDVSSVDEIKHNLVRAALTNLNIRGGIEITSIADIPSKGTGLGSSSSFTVGLLHALYAYEGRYRSSEHLASESCLVEIDICKEPIGKQDQYAAAYGGLNLIRFDPDGTVSVDPIICRPETVDQIQQSIVAFYTGVTRSASGLLSRQSESMSLSRKKQVTMQKMVQLAYLLREELQKNNADVFGEILHENWVLKKSLSQEISNSGIDHWYERAMVAGASGGKLLGAGAGGFMIFFAPRERHEAIRNALSDLRPVNFRFENSGSRIIFYQ